MKTLKEAFKVILEADKEESRKAARLVRKLLYSSAGGGNKLDDISHIIDNAPAAYAKIKEDFRQENFVMAISVIYFLHGRDTEPDFLFPWFLELIKHKNGYIRYAVLRMFSNDFGPLTYHIRCPGEKSSSLGFSSEVADHIIYKLFMCLDNMAISLYEPKYKKYKYIDSLPVGPYKTVQQTLATLSDDCGEEYLKRFFR